MEVPPPPPPPVAVPEVKRRAGDEQDGNRYVRQSGEREETELVELHSEGGLREAARQLLEEKWPKADEAREAQLQQSCAELPLGLVLREKKGEKTVGFVMLLRCVEEERGVIAESVVVAEQARGMGYGRVLMESMHAKARALGFEQVYLCTRDKRDFYQHLGYTICPPVTPKTAAAQLVDSQAVDKLKGLFGGGNPTQSDYLWLKTSLPSSLM